MNFKILFLSVSIISLMLISCATTSSQINVEAMKNMPDVLRVAVLVDSNVPDSGDLLNQRFFNALVKFKQLKPIERTKLNAIMQEKKLQMSGLTTETATEVAKIAGADAIFVGSLLIYKKNGRLGSPEDASISMRLVSTKDYQILWSADHTTDYDFVPVSSMAGIGTIVELCTKSMINELEKYWH